MFDKSENSHDRNPIYPTCDKDVKMTVKLDKYY